MPGERPTSARPDSRSRRGDAEPSLPRGRGRGAKRTVASLVGSGALALLLVACGARTELLGPGEGGGGAGGVEVPCDDGITEPCGSNVGECRQGTWTCRDGEFGPCIGELGPRDETCNGLDDDCDGAIDDGFHVGEACDGPDADLCLDDVMSCAGCSVSASELEVCNGVDDNCNGIVDADCELGDCTPTLLVVGSTPSSPGCIDFPVQAGSMGIIEYPCTGGPVSATLGGIQFTGSVTNGVVSLTGTATVVGPDGCTWQTDHAITGNIPQGTLNYTYEEFLVVIEGFCWSPCTETGTVSIEWTER